MKILTQAVVPNVVGKLQCKTCNTLITYRGTTKNLRYHMIKYHKDRVFGLQQFIEPRNVTSRGSGTLPSTSTRNYGGGRNASLNLPSSSRNLKSPPQGDEEAEKQLVRMMVKSLQPLSLVENEEFVKFVQALKPNYSVPSRDALEKLIGHYYGTISEKIRQDLKTVKYFSVATEKLTSFEGKNFLAVTVYFIDEEECKLKSYFLDCFPIGETDEVERKLESLFNLNETVTNIVSKIETLLLANWGLRDLNNLILISHLEIPISTTMVPSKWTCIKPCYTYLFINMLKETFDKISPITEKIKKNVEALQKTFNLDFPSVDRTTPQNMLNLYNKVLEKQADIKSNSSNFMANLEQNGKLSDTDWTILQKIRDILEVSNAINENMNDDQSYMNISIVLLYSYKLSSSLSELGIGTSDLLLSKLRQIFQKHLTDIKSNSIYYESTLLDPRYKNKFQNEDKDTFTLARNRLNEQLTKPVPSTSNHSCSTFSLFPDLYNRTDRNLNSTNRISTELNKYLEEPVLDPNENPLVWWKNNKITYPNLFEIVKKRFCVPVTCPSCNLILFPKSEKMQAKKFLLDSENFKQILFLHSNM